MVYYLGSHLITKTVDKQKYNFLLRAVINCDSVQVMAKSISVPVDDQDEKRVEAIRKEMSRKSGVQISRRKVLAMLITKGLESAERENG